MIVRDGGVRQPRTRAGIGLRAPHVAEMLERRPPVGWLEVHAENYMGGGPSVRALDAIRRDYDIAIHGVGLSLGSADGIDGSHLVRLHRLVERMEPTLVSEHLSWSVFEGAYLNHLLPLPLTEEALAITARNVDRVQETLGRRLLIENPSSYLRFAHSTIPEPIFIAELARRTGCGILCDVNNLYVSQANVGLEARRALELLPVDAVGEIHLAGHAVNDADGVRVLVDDHGAPVANAVWRLYVLALDRFGAVPTLIEWDTNLPALDVLLGEAAEAERLLEHVERGAHVCAA
jgi:uncharacterized protein (UPF0276 family)